MITRKYLENKEFYVTTEEERTQLAAKLKEFEFDTQVLENKEYGLPRYFHTWDTGNRMSQSSCSCISSNGQWQEQVKLEELIMKNYIVSEQFIKEAYKAACSTWKTKLEEQFPEVFPRTYKVGDTFVDSTVSGLELTICRLGSNIFLVCTGSRYKFEQYSDRTVDVKDYNRITEEELKVLFGSDFGDFKLKK